MLGTLAYVLLSGIKIVKLINIWKIMFSEKRLLMILSCDEIVDMPEAFNKFLW